MARRNDEVGALSLLSPEYMELQRELHARGNYGTSGHRWVQPVSALIERHGYTSVLDYGCGQGQLKSGLGEIVTEYDPCIDGKDSDPASVDLVVCTDVLEHIEPECLDDVLFHIRLKLKDDKARFLFNIALGEASKTLADGRNAHLLIRTADWWKDKLQSYFWIEEFRVRQGEDICGVARKAQVFGQIKPIGVMSNDDRNDHAALNVKRTDKRLPQDVLPARAGSIILACYGPSLRDTFDTLLAQKKAGGTIVSVSGAHDYLVERGVIPDYHVECDPRAHKADMLANPQRGTKYLMASCCHPVMFDRLDGFDVTIWHLLNGNESFAIRDIPSEKLQALIPGGGSVGLRSLPLFYFLGFREFFIHGMDCSFGDSGRHAGPHTGKVVGESDVHPKVDLCFGKSIWSDRKFKSAPIMLAYANQFLKEMRNGRYPGCKIMLRGDGLLQEMMRLEGLQRQSFIQAADAFGFELTPKPTRDYFSLIESDLEPETRSAA